MMRWVYIYMWSETFYYDATEKKCLLQHILKFDLEKNCSITFIKVSFHAFRCMWTILK